MLSFLSPIPVRSSAPDPGTVAIRIAVPFRLLSCGRDSVNEFAGFPDGWAASTVTPAVPLLGVLKVSPRYAAVMLSMPAAAAAKVCWHVDCVAPIVISEQLAGGPNDPGPEAVKSTVPLGGLRPAGW